MSDEARPLPPWPDVPRICFGPGEDWHLNACVGWVQSRPHEMHGYIEGYRKAAVALFEHAVESGASPDYLVFPIAFLWRQHLELALKDIIATGRQMNGESWGFPGCHGLARLWQEAKLHVLACGPPDAPEIDHVEANILEFEAIDPGSDGFRYPVDKERKGRSLPEAPEYVNLGVLHEGMMALSNFLQGVRCELGSRMDYVDERGS